MRSKAFSAICDDREQSEQLQIVSIAKGRMTFGDKRRAYAPNMEKRLRPCSLA